MTPAITAYASRMGLLTNNKPNVDAIKKFQTANGLKADGIIGGNTAGAILSAQKPGASNRGGPTAAQVANTTGQSATPAKPAAPAKPPRYKTPQEYDREIARFSKTSDPKLAPNARYIATLQAEKAALAGAAPAKQAATPAAATPTTSGGRPFAAPAARTFEESVDLMRRLSNILKE
jgi:peptidoglycan hydrolase-like protein with peptidoglycan-binding domain